jgi:hypothetical protein
LKVWKNPLELFSGLVLEVKEDTILFPGSWFVLLKVKMAWGLRTCAGSTSVLCVSGGGSLNMTVVPGKILCGRSI